MGCSASSTAANNPNAPKERWTTAQFSIIKTLGEGASCRVLQVKDKRTGSQYALKVLNKSGDNHRTMWEVERAILSEIKSRNIVELVNGWEERDGYYLATVLCTGGELFDRVRQGHFSERVASRLAHEALQALVHCHSRGVVHRDLKPENFVFENPSEDSPMKLIDFGCARKAADADVISDVAGSAYYCAPEVLQSQFVRTCTVWKASDLWSLGVIIFLLVCGYPPFNGDSQETIFRRSGELLVGFGVCSFLLVLSCLFDFVSTESALANSNSLQQTLELSSLKLSVI